MAELIDESDLLENEIEDFEVNDDIDHGDEVRQVQQRRKKKKKKVFPTRVKNPGRLAEELGKRLEHASTILVDRLFDYLSKLPTECSQKLKPDFGLTLPASAIGWLSTQMFPLSEEEEDPTWVQPSLWMGPSMRDRLALLKYLLPRATHLRVSLEEWPPPKTASTRRHDRNGRNSSNNNGNFDNDFVGRDVSLSAISVHSGVTMDTHQQRSGPPPNVQSFLVYYHELRHHPRVDMQLFPNLRVLFLEKVPPEWVTNLSFLAEKLELVRSQSAALFDMQRFLFQTTTNISTINEDPLAPTAGKPAEFIKLTHLKMTNSGIGELSGMRGRRSSSNRGPKSPRSTHEDPLEPPLDAAIPTPPPLSRLPSLVSLSLANNELRTVKTALAGLSSLSHLTRLDLSNNFIESFEGANKMLGNLKTLVLTGNRIVHVKGLDKLYSLQKLFLGKNQLSDFASVAGLGNLPELKELYLNKNPFIKLDKVAYRVRVFNFFKEARMGSSLLPSATYRHLLEILPLLDGSLATKREMVGLRSLTFRQQTVAVMDLVTVITTPEAEQAGTAADDTAITEVVIRPPPRVKRVSRTRRRRKVVLDEGVGEDFAIVLPRKTQPPEIAFTAHDVIQRLADQQQPSEAENNNEASASALEESAHTFASASAADDGDSPSLRRNSFISLHSEDNLLDYALREHDRRAPKTITLEVSPTSVPLSSFVSIPTEDPSTNNDDAGEEDENNDGNSLEDCPVESRSSDGTGSSTKENGAPSDENNEKTRLGPPESPEKSLSSRFKDLMGSLQDEEAMPTGGSTIKPALSNNESVMTRETGGLKRDALNTNTISNPFEEGDDKETEKSPLDYLGTTSSVAFPDLVWGGDNQSLASSLGASRLSRDDFPSENRYHGAEKNSVYDGSDEYKHLSINTNLELYFRSFVFPTKDPDFSVKQRGLKGEALDKGALEAAPRIQLRPIDRKIAVEALKKTLTSLQYGSAEESFKRVWREDVLACGKSASRRVKPQKTQKRGFHGDVLFEDGGKEGTVCEYRRLILCSSDTALYFIPDHEANNAIAPDQTDSRRFPTPVPEEALFQNALWPHACARHPINTLECITIGFGFQRLTLHFSPSSATERNLMGGDLTYILRTSDKKRTVKLLQHFQDLVRESSHPVTVKKDEDKLVIDNDDKQFLDSLSAAVQPNSIGAVLHYQILQQRWKRGDREDVRRACIVTDSHIYLLDEDYVGDGSESYEAGARALGDVRFSLVHSALLTQIAEVQAARADPKAITIVIRPLSMLQRLHNWRLVCVDGDGAAKLVDDVRNAMEMAVDGMGV